jgi:hypothetical protein
MDHCDPSGRSDSHAAAVAQAPFVAPSTVNEPAAGPAPRELSTLDVGEMESYPFVYAIGRIEPRFPSLGLERELAQVTGRADTSGLTDREGLRRVLSERSNRYLARQICWVLRIEGLETYILQPRDPLDFELLVEAVRPAPGGFDVDVVIGVRGPIAPPEACNGLMVPIVAFDQIYSFDRDALIDSIPRPEGLPKKEEASFAAAAAELFDRIMQMADNAGATDEDRALNYLAVRYPAIYSHTAEQYRRNFSLAAVEVRRSPLSGARKIADVIFSYTHRETGFSEQFFLRADVTEEFLFLVRPLAPYFER